MKSTVNNFAKKTILVLEKSVPHREKWILFNLLENEAITQTKLLWHRKLLITCWSHVYTSLIKK